MEKETLLVVLNSQKIANDSTGSGNRVDHVDSDNLDTVPEQENENESVEENEDDNNKGVVSVSIQSIKIYTRPGVQQCQAQGLVLCH